MKAIKVFFLSAFLCDPVFSQSQYSIQWINPYPNIYKVNDIELENSSTGYILEHDIYYSRISKTTNGGVNWFIVDSSRKYLTDIDFLNAETGYVSSSQYIFKTNNGLESQTPVFSVYDYSIDGGFISKIDFINPGTGFTAGYFSTPFGTSGLSLKTTNGGTGWNFSTSYNFDYNLGITFKGNTGFYFGIDSISLKFFWSHNTGGSWILKEFNIGTPNIYGYAVADSLNSFLLGMNTVYKTTNSGDSWFEQFISPYRLNGIKFLNNAGIIVCDSGKYYKSTDKGITWMLYSNTNSINNLLSISYLNENEIWIGGEGGSIFKTINSGINWYTNSTNVIKNNLEKIENVDSTMFIIGESGKIIKSTNNGINFIGQNSNTVSNLSDIQFIDSLNGYVCGNNVFLKTTNGGLNWQNINTGHSDFYFNLSFINISTGWIGSRYGKYLKTTNGGINWQLLNFINTEFITEIYFINENTGWIGSHETKIYKTTDGGNSWILQFSLPSVAFIRKMEFITPDIGAALFDAGVALTTNGGNNWNYNNNFGNHDHYDIDLFDSSRALFVGGFGTIHFTSNFGNTWNAFDANTMNDLNGVKFRNKHYAFISGDRGIIMNLTLPGTIGISVNGNQIPMYIKLYQNYPNPFNPKTIINYSIPSNVKGQTLNVKLVVYNNLGKEIATLVDEKQNPGTYAVDFNGEGLPSGVYFYKLETGDFAEAKRMILIK